MFASPAAAVAQNVGDYVRDDGCSSAVVRGLADQLVDELNCLYPGTLETFEEGGQLAFASGAVLPALQTNAVHALQDALAERPGSTLTINSALRALPQQYLLYQWYQQGRCGIQIAASPGTSPHESAKAIDISEYDAWRDALQAHGWDWYGSGDRVHYTYGGAVEDIRSASVLAFQTLWNANHPEDPIAEDGDYGPQTESHLALAPADGFAIGTTCQPCAQGRHARFDAVQAPAEVELGQGVDVSVTFTNTGEATWAAGQVFLLAVEPAVPLDHDVIQGASATFVVALSWDVPGPVSLPLRLVDAGGATLAAGCDGAAEGTLSLTVREAPPGGDPDEGGGDPGGEGEGEDPGPGDPMFDGPDEGPRVGGLTGCALAPASPAAARGALVVLLPLLVAMRRRRAQYALRSRCSSTR